MANEIFYRFAPFIQDYIYRIGWEELRPVQTVAAQVIFDTPSNLILSSNTASGKTEAAFFPCISQIYEDMPNSVAILYIAPLKSLINDQFERIGELLDECDIPVCHWHGDVAMSQKTKLLQNPRGVLQITPESLESMLMNRANDIPRLFGGLKFVIIDEIHMLIGSDRGSQIICLLDRISRAIGSSPRRIGLSATVGDLTRAAEWLGAGTGRDTAIPELAEDRPAWRLAAEHFFITSKAVPRELAAAEDAEAVSPSGAALPEGKESAQGAVVEEHNGYSPIDAGYEYMYDCSRAKRTIIFSNSREETEYVTATMRQIAKLRGDEDLFFIHHGNLSAPIREEAERRLKHGEKCVVCATVTLELGIDVGRLERIVHLDSPNSVSSFLQRLGRSGRRGEPPEMFLVFREEEPIPDATMPQLIPWSLIRAIAIIQLYLEEHFIEEPKLKKLPLSLMLQQTLSISASSGAMTPKRLADRVLSLSPFAHVDREDYRTLLVSMIKSDLLELTEEGEVIIGLKGEKLISGFRFYAVFKDSEDYSVRCGSEDIGTISTPPPLGDRFALAGRVWEVEELDIQRKLIYVKSVDGKMEISWPGDFGEIHTKILRRMRQVLCEDTVYKYLKPGAAARLDKARAVFRAAGATERSIFSLGGYTKCFFPWLGTRSFRTMRKYLQTNAPKLGIYGIEFEGCYYMTFKYEGDERELMRRIADDILACTPDPQDLVSPRENPVFEKYDGLIPGDLLRKAYALDRLRTDELVDRMRELSEEN